MAGNIDLANNIGAPLAQLLKRPEITIEQLAPVLRDLAPDLFVVVEGREPKGESPDTLLTRTLPAFREQPVAKSASHLPTAIREELKSVETEIKYEGYLQQQQRAIERLKEIPADRPKAVLCAGGLRSSSVISALLRAGISGCHNVAGGMREWSKAGYSTVKPGGSQGGA